MHIVSVGADVVADDELLRGRHIHIVSGLELPVSHVILFHVHKRGVMIRFAITVPISADMQILCVLLPPFQPAVHQLDRFLQGGLVMPFSRYMKQMFSRHACSMAREL